MRERNRILIFTALFCLLMVGLQVVLAIFKKDVLANFDWYGRAFVALIITLILSFATKSYAKVTGTYLSNNFQISGAIVIFALIFTSSYFKEIFFKTAPFSFSVQIKDYDRSAFSGSTDLYFLKGTYKASAEIQEDGIAYFLNIPVTLKDSVVQLQLSNKDGLRISKGDTIKIADGTSFLISITGHAILKGDIRNGQQAVTGVKINIVDLDTTITSDDRGRFELVIPVSQLQPSYHVIFRKGKLSTSGTISANSFSQFNFQAL